MAFKLMEVILKGVVQNQLYINRFNLIPFWTGAEPDSLIISPYVAQALGYDGGDNPPTADSFLLHVMNTFCLGAALDEIQVRDVYDENDLFTSSLTASAYNGAQGAVGQLQQSYVVSKLKTNRTQQGVRAGTMSLGSVPDNQVNDQGFLTSTWVGLLQNVCDALNDLPEVGVGGFDFIPRPCVVQKQRYAIEHLPPKPDTYAYRYYTDPAVQATHIMYGVQWTPYDTARSLVSRKIGKGR